VSDGEAPPQYDLPTVEAALLEVTVELHPRHLPARELREQIVCEPEDRREVNTANQAIANLREFGLFSTRRDDIVEPTPAALHAVALLARMKIRPQRNTACSEMHIAARYPPNGSDLSHGQHRADQADDCGK
jgi:hypothetical protein